MDAISTLEERAASYGRRLARGYFKNRKGHGGAPVTKVTFTEAEMAALVAVAYQQGAKDR